MAGPYGATISVTTCFIRRDVAQPVVMRTMSPVRREDVGSETRWDWKVRKCCGKRRGFSVDLG